MRRDHDHREFEYRGIKFQVSKKLIKIGNAAGVDIIKTYLDQIDQMRDRKD